MTFHKPNKLEINLEEDEDEAVAAADSDDELSILEEKSSNITQTTQAETAITPWGSNNSQKSDSKSTAVGS